MSSTPLVSGSATAVRAFCTDATSRHRLEAMPEDHMRICVERCVAELRAGRPIRIDHGAEQWLVHAAETMLEQDCATEDFSTWFLVLPPERLQALGATFATAATCPLDRLSRDEAHAIVHQTHVQTLPDMAPASIAESAALDLVKFAQLLPAAIIRNCDDLDTFAWTLNASIESIRSYHHEVAATLTIVARTPVPLLDDADAEFVVFRGSDGLKDQVAIIVGRPDPDAPTPIRLHSACLTGDLFGSLKCDCGEQLRSAIRTFARSGGGILLYLDQEGRGIGLGNKMRAYALQSKGYDTLDADAMLGFGTDERRYEIAAQMLALLGHRRVSLLTNNPRKIAALTVNGIEVTDRIALIGTMNPHNERYLRSKVERAGHMSDCVQPRSD